MNESYFYSFIDENKLNYKQIREIFDMCIPKISSSFNLEINDIVIAIDTYCWGLKFSYDLYKQKKVIKVITSKGLKVIDKNGTSYEDISEFRDNAESTVKHMAINATGARPGETITGIHNISKDSIMKILDGIIPPMKDDLDKVRLFPDLWTVFINKLSSIEFFNTLNNRDRVEWLSKNERDGEYDIAETDVFVEVLDVGKSKFTELLTAEQITQILSGDTNCSDGTCSLRESPRGAWSVMNIRNMFPLKPGSKGLKGRPVLLFYLHFWKLSVSFHSVNEFKGLVYNMKTNKLEKDIKNEKITLFEGLTSQYEETNKGYESSKKQRFGVILSESSDTPKYFNLLLDFWGKKYTKENIDGVIKSCKGFTAAGYKSLLQKIIRFSPKSVTIGTENVKSDFVLTVVFTLLLTNPGSFVPDIQRFVSGQESAIKRLAVCILEDSSIPSEYNWKLLKL